MAMNVMLGPSSICKTILESLDIHHGIYRFLLVLGYCVDPYVYVSVDLSDRVVS